MLQFLFLLQVGDPYLDIKRASLCVETLLEHFGNRQILISESWQTWQTNITVEKEFKIRWEMNITESTRVSVYTALCCAFVSVKAVTLCFSVNAQQLHYVLCLCTPVTLCFCVCAQQLHYVLCLCTPVTLCFYVCAQQLHCVFLSVHSSYIVFLCLCTAVILYLCLSTAVTLCFCVCALHCS